MNLPCDHLVIDCAPLLEWVPPGRVFLVAFIHQPAIGLWMSTAGSARFMLLPDSVVQKLVAESFERRLFVGAFRDGVLTPVKIVGA